MMTDDLADEFVFVFVFEFTGLTDVDDGALYHDNSTLPTLGILEPL